MDLLKSFSGILDDIKVTKPLVHHITNYVTVNDCANIVLAFGGSPVMADDPKEVEEMVSMASSLVINVGTLNERTIKSFLLAGKKANSLDIPVILDPVGVGATRLRSKTVKDILKDIKLSVIRGNMSEIKYIYDSTGITRGVDSIHDSLQGGKEIAMELSQRLSCIVAITGKIDIVSNGNKTYYVENGHEILSRITGTGCMTTSLIGVSCGAKRDNLMGAILGIMTMGIAGEKAYNLLEDKRYYGSFKESLMNFVGTINFDDYREKGRIYEV